MGCTGVELLFCEEDGEVNLRVKLMMRFAVELIFRIICIIFLLPDTEYMFEYKY